MQALDERSFRARHEQELATDLLKEYLAYQDDQNYEIEPHVTGSSASPEFPEMIGVRISHPSGEYFVQIVRHAFGVSLALRQITLTGLPILATRAEDTFVIPEVPFELYRPADFAPA